MGTGHDHASRSADRRLAVAVALNVVVVLTQVVAGLTAGSVGLLADAGHNLADTGAVLLALLALRLARRPASGARTYGFHRAGVLAAQANAAVLVAVAAVVAVESVRRLGDPPEVDGTVVLVVASCAALLNGLAAWVVHAGSRDLASRSAALHLAADAGVSVAVALAGLGIVVGGADLAVLDPAVSLLVVTLVAALGVRLLRETAEVLLEAAPAGVDLDALVRDVREVPGVLGVHDLHVWSLSESVHAASLHLVLDTGPAAGLRLVDAQTTLREVKAVLAERHGIAHATVETEPAASEPDAAGCDPHTSPLPET